MEHEDELLRRIFAYAEELGYTRHASTLVEAWRLSVSGLSKAIGESAESMDTLPVLLPEDDYTSDPLCTFAITEAIRHRERGVPLTMFLGLFKYYRQGYLDTIREDSTLSESERAGFCEMIDACFSRIELGFLQEWTSHGDSEHIAELQRRGRELTHEKNMFLTVLESLRQPVVLVDEDGTLLYMHWSLSELKQRPGNTYYCDIDASCDRPEGFTRNASKVFPWLAVDLKDFRESGDEDRTVVREINVEDAPRFIEVTMSRMQTVGTESSGIVMLFNDITDAKENHSKELTYQKLASLGELASGIAHEINTPIQYISSNLEFLATVMASMRGDDAEEMREAISESMEGADRISRIVNSMKRFAHGGAASAQAADVNDIIADTATICRNEWKYSAELKLNLEENLPLLNCNGGEIGQLILNLIVNASQAVEEKFALSDEKGLIEVGTSSTPQGIEIRVSDNGPGIPEEIRDKVFDLFFTTKPQGKGSGQGLSIANSVVKRHGGTLSLASTVGEGTTFTAFFPFENVDSESDEGDDFKYFRPNIP